MTSRLNLAGAAAIAVLCCTLIAAAPASARQNGEGVRLPDCGGSSYGGGVAPVQWDRGCTGVRDLTSMTWTGWGGASASGTGITQLNDCEPSCAEGAVSGYPVRGVRQCRTARVVWLATTRASGFASSFRRTRHSGRAGRATSRMTSRASRRRRPTAAERSAIRLVKPSRSGPTGCCAGRRARSSFACSEPAARTLGARSTAPAGSGPTVAGSRRSTWRAIARPFVAPTPPSKSRSTWDSTELAVVRGPVTGGT